MKLRSTSKVLRVESVDCRAGSSPLPEGGELRDEKSAFQPTFQSMIRVR